MKTFDFESGHLALDFANTLEWHASEHPVERLASYADLLAWAQAAGLVDDRQARALLELSSTNPEAAQAAYQRALALREALYRLFSALAAQQPPDVDDLGRLTAALADSVEHGRLEHGPAGFSWSWPAADSCDRPLWPVARAAADLLQDEQLQRVGECADDRGCGYLFLDTSRNHSRRWCSMESCGNRAKARSHYRRARQESPA